MAVTAYRYTGSKPDSSPGGGAGRRDSISSRQPSIRALNRKSARFRCSSVVPSASATAMIARWAARPAARQEFMWAGGTFYALATGREERARHWNRRERSDEVGLRGPQRGTAFHVRGSKRPSPFRGAIAIERGRTVTIKCEPMPAVANRRDQVRIAARRPTRPSASRCDHAR